MAGHAGLHHAAAIDLGDVGTPDSQGKGGWRGSTMGDVGEDGIPRPR